MAHLHRNLRNPKARPLQEQDHFRFRIILWIPVSKGPDDGAISRPKPAGTVSHWLARERPDQQLKPAGADFAHQALAIFAGLEESRSDNQIRGPIHEELDQPAHFGWPMLAVPIDLHRYFIAVQRGITIAGLHCAADSEIKGQAHNRHIGWHLADGVISRTIIDNQHVEFRQSPPKPMNDLADRCAFIKDRNDGQTTNRDGAALVVSVPSRHNGSAIFQRTNSQLSSPSWDTVGANHCPRPDRWFPARLAIFPVPYN